MHLFVDLETNGLPKSRYAFYDDIDNWPRVVQVAWAVYTSDGKRNSIHNFIVYPEDFEISDESASIHGITTDRAREEGTALNKVLKEFNKELENAQTIISHNIDGSSPILGFLVIYKGLHKIEREKSHTAGSYPM